MANWVLVVKWARFDSTFASPDWATFIFIVRVVSEDFDFTKTASITNWPFCTRFTDLLSTFNWFAPLFSTTTSGVSTDSFNFEFAARNHFIRTLNDFFHDQTRVVTGTSSFDAFVLISTVVFIPEFTSGMFNTTLVPTNVTILWIDALITLKDFSFWTEASLFVVADKSHVLPEIIEQVVLASLWHLWTTGLPFFTSFASFAWASQVEVISGQVVWNNVFRSPVIDTVTSVAATLLGKFVDLITAGESGNSDVEFALVVFAVSRQFVVTFQQVVVWIGDGSTVVQVWVDIHSVTFVREFSFTFVAWKVSTFLDLFTFIGWAAGVTNNVEFDKSEPVVIIFLSNTGGFIWSGALFAFAGFFHTSAFAVFVLSPSIFLVSVTFEVVDLWTVAGGAFSSVAAAIKVIDSSFAFSTIRKFSGISNTLGARFVFLNPS